MTTMLTEVYDAFRDAGASDEKARKAAEAMAQMDNKFALVHTELAVLKWMTGSVLVIVIGIMGRLLLVH